VTSLVVKVGGNVVAGDAMSAIADGIAALCGRGDRVAMVHGGGPQATALQERLGQEPNVIGGRRITDADALEVMKMVVGGQLNVDLCAALLAAGARPVGLHGASSLAVEARVRPPRVVSGCGPDPVNFGLVGDVVGFNRELLDLLQSAGYVPVIACLGAQPDGVVLNINADIVANQLAEAIAADHLVLVTSAPGVLRNIDDATSRIERLTASEARAAIADGTVAGGMIPKLEESIRVLSSGVGSIHIVGDLGPGDLLREIDSPGAVGTALLADRD
jgi:acetylglutamate kinase